MARSPRAKKAELADILSKLQENGFDCKGSDENKLLQLWTVYLQSEGSLKAALDNIEQLRKQQAEEMQEVENYVEHIRSLSDEREALTLEFEQENEQLKQEVEQLKLELASGQNAETKEMLAQQGLDEIAEGSTSEQVAYLLVERARLLDELEAEMQKNQDGAQQGLSDEQVEMIIKSERAEFEKELAQEQQNMKKLKQQLQETHDKEIMEFQTKNKKIEEELESAKSKIVDFEFEREEARCALDHEKQTTASSGKEMDRLKEEKKKAQEELLSVKGRVRTLEENNKDLEKSATQASEELKDVKERLNKELAVKTDEITKLSADCDTYQKDIAKFEGKVASFESESKALQMKLDFALKDLDDTKKREKDILESKSNNEQLEMKYRNEIDELSSKNQQLLLDMSGLKDKLQQEEKQRTNQENKLAHNEKTVERLQKDMSAKETELSLTNAELKNEKSLRRNAEEDLEACKDEIEELKNNQGDHQSVVSELKATKERLNEETKVRKELEVKVSTLDELERKITELENKCGSLQKENKDLQENLKDMKKNFDSLEAELSGTKSQLETANKQGLDSTSAQQDELRELRKKLDTEKSSRLESEKKLDSAQKTYKQKESEMDAKHLSLNVQLEDLQDKLSAMKAKLSDSSKKQEEITKTHQQAIADAESETRLLEQKVKQLESESKTAAAVNTSHTEEASSVLNSSLKSTEAKLETVGTSLKEVTTQRDQLLKQRDDLQSEIDDLKSRDVPSQADLDEHMERIQMLETITQQLETDNRDLAEKLSEALIQSEELEGLLRKEKGKNKDSMIGTSDKLHEAQKTILDLQAQARDLQDKCLQKEAQIKRIETDFGSDVAVKERTITKLNDSLAHLTEEINYSKVTHKSEIDSLGEKLESAYREIQQTRAALREKDEELFQSQHDASKTIGSTSRLEVQLASEERLRKDLEERNKVLEEEMAKAWAQMRELLEKISTLETDKHRLEEENLLNFSSPRHNSTSLLASLDRNNPSVQLAMSRTEDAERKAATVQADLEDAKSKLYTAETELREAATIRADLQARKDEIIRLANQLQEEKLHRSLDNDKVEELKRHVMNLQEKENKASSQNHELQHTLLDLESTITTMKEETELVSELQKSAEHSKLTLGQQMSALNQERETLQIELMAANEKYNLQLKKYDCRKARHKAKLQKARELYSSEKGRLREKVKTLEEDLSLAKTSLDKEIVWKTTAEEKNKHLQLEKRQLISQNAELEEKVRDKSRQVSVLNVRVKYLEDEATQLEQRATSLMRQKSNLDKLVKEQKLSKNHSFHELQLASSPSATPSAAPTIATSGLGNSLTSSQAWDPHLIDAMLTTVSVRDGPDPEHSMNGLSRTFSMGDT